MIIQMVKHNIQIGPSINNNIKQNNKSQKLKKNLINV